MAGYNRCSMDHRAPVLLAPPPPPATDPDLRRFLELAESALGARWIEVDLLLGINRRPHRYCHGTRNGAGRRCLLERRGQFRAELRHDGENPPPPIERLLGFALEQALAARHVGVQVRLVTRAMDATSSAVLLFDDRGEIVYANPRAEELLVRQTMGDLQVELTPGTNVPLLSHLTRLAARQVSRTEEKLSGQHILRDGTRVLWELAILGSDETGDALAVLAVVRMVCPDHPRVTSAVLAQFGLTRREREVVEHLVSGLSTREIAQRMGISPHTVRDHLKHLFRKTGARSRREILALAGATRADEPPPAPVGP